MNCPDDLDIEAFVLSVDPDWTDHWNCIDQAFEFYWKLLEPKQIADAIKEAR